VQHAKDNGMQAMALTDHGWMAGIIDFYKAFKKADLHPLLGTEAYCTDDPDRLFNEDKTRDNMHTILIAKNNTGYSKLLELVSNAAINNFYYKPRIYREHLRELGGNAIMTSGCLGGCIASRLSWETDQYGRAIACIDSNNIISREVEYYLDVFGDDFYLELQVCDNEDNFQHVYNQWLLNFGRERQIPFVITADCHYIKKEDSELHEMIMAMQMKKTLAEYRENSEMTYGPYFYVASPAEMLERAQSINCEEAYYNTIKIAKQCNVEITLGQYEEPIFDITQMNDYKDFLQYKKDNLYG
jgi:DNA polymerase-3 subunit alpha